MKKKSQRITKCQQVWNVNTMVKRKRREEGDLVKLIKSDLWCQPLLPMYMYVPKNFVNVWYGEGFFKINLYVKMVLYITLCINFIVKKKRINQFSQLYKIIYAHVCTTLVFLYIILLLKIQDTCTLKFKFYRFCLYFFIPCFTAPSAPSCGRPL